MCDVIHPLDVEKLRHLGELLHDFASGRNVRRAEIADLVASLMICIRDSCSDEGAEIVTDRLLALADSRFAAWELADDALAEIRLNEAMPT